MFIRSFQLASQSTDRWVVGLIACAVIGAGIWLAICWRKHTLRLRANADAWPEGADLQERREWVAERIAYWWVQANRAHNTAIEDIPEVQFSPRLKHALGWADSSRNLIKISDHHLMDKSKRVTDETVAHEVAHIFADRFHGKPCRHGKLWKNVMLALGQKPEVCFLENGDEAASPADAA